MSSDAVVPLKEYWTRLELRFGESEAVLDYPSPAIDLYDFWSVVPKVGADAVEAVNWTPGLSSPVEGVSVVLGDLAVHGAFLALDKALEAILALAKFAGVPFFMLCSALAICFPRICRR